MMMLNPIKPQLIGLVSSYSSLSFSKNAIILVASIILIYTLCPTAKAQHNGNSGVASENTGESMSSEESTNYGERLAESSYHQFTSSFAREPKDENNIYSAGINAILNSDGFLNQMEKFGGQDPKYSPQGPVEMAVHSKKTVEVIPVKFEDPGDGEPQVIEISPYEVPVSIVFKTQTNKLNVNQEHKKEPAEEVKEINSEEEPHRVVHNVYRPVIQEVTEVVQPYRKVIQKVEPVIEEMKTIISKAAPRDGSVMAQQQPATSFFGSAGRTSSGGFSGFGMDNAGNKGGLSRFADFHMSQIAYGSDVINKVAPAPATMISSHVRQTPNTGSYMDNISKYSKAKRLSHRLGHQINSSSNGNNNDDVMDNEQNPPTQQTITKLEPLQILDKEANYQYNDIIKHYIDNFLHGSKSNEGSQNQGQNQLGSNQNPQTSPSTINANSIKILNLPMKNMPKSKQEQSSNQSSEQSDNNSSNDSNNSNNNANNNSNKKYKIIKEFRISLNDIKKELNKRVNGNAAALTGGHSLMMRPFASFSVSANSHQGVKTKPSNNHRSNEPTKIRHQKDNNSEIKLGEFSRRSRVNHVSPLRNYHYMNFKRFGDAVPMQSQQKENYHHFHHHHKHHHRTNSNNNNNNNNNNGHHFNRRMMENSNLQWQHEHINRYSNYHPEFRNNAEHSNHHPGQNRFRLTRRYGIIY